jgi:hypothetical protein
MNNDIDIQTHCEMAEQAPVDPLDQASRPLGAPVLTSHRKKLIYIREYNKNRYHTDEDFRKKIIKRISLRYKPKSRTREEITYRNNMIKNIKPEYIVLFNQYVYRYKTNHNISRIDACNKSYERFKYHGYLIDDSISFPPPPSN